MYLKLILLVSSQFLFPQTSTVRSKAAPWMEPRPLFAAELEIQSSAATREDLGTKLMEDKGVRECLRQSLVNSGDDFSVRLTGHVTPKGVIRETKAETYRPEPLAQCIQDAANSVKLSSKPKAEDFDVTIGRHRVTNGDAKIFTIDLNDPAK